MANKAPIYREEGIIGNKELLDQLKVAVNELEIRMKASKTVYKGVRQIGFGVDKLQRNLAADTVIAVARAIKSLKGW